MSAPASIPVFGDAYLADTQHLTLEEHGAYFKLMIVAWRSHGCALPDDDKRIATMLGIGAKKWAALRPAVMAFWTLTEAGWQQKRLLKEYIWATDKAKRNSEAAAARWGAKPQETNEPEHANASADASANGYAPPPPPPKKAQKDKPSVPRERVSPIRLPMDWQPSADDIAYAQQRGIGRTQAGDIAEDFRTYWTLGKGRNTTHLNWSKAWQTWIRREKPSGVRDDADDLPTPTLIAAKPGEAPEATQFRRAIAEAVGHNTYRGWFEKLSIRVDGDRMALVAPSSFAADHVRNNHGSHVQRVAKALFAGSREVIILAPTNGRRAA